MQKALNIFEEKVGDLSKSALSYLYLGDLAYLQNQVGEAQASYYKALKIFEDIGDFSKAASVYSQLGKVAQQTGQLEEARAYYQKALKIKEDKRELYHAAHNYLGLALIAKEQHNFESAIAYLQKAFKDFSAVNNWLMASFSLNEWGLTLEIQENWSEALQIYIRALVIISMHNQQNLMVLITWKLKQMLKHLGESQFDTIWREEMGEDCGGEIREVIRRADNLQNR